MKKQGVLSLDYHEGRKTKRALMYRLQRRTQEIIWGIAKYKCEKKIDLLDIGTADALMLDMLQRNVSINKSVGMDFSRDLLLKGCNEELNLIQADAVHLPFHGETFDVIVATAVIEHVPAPDTMLAECFRVLRKDGICLLTTPDPFFEKIATKIEHLEDEDHVQTFNLNDLKQLFLSNGFNVLEAYKFMISPIGFPFELKVERFFRMAKLGSLLLNQAIIAKKKS